MKKSQVFVGIFGVLIALNSTWLMADVSAKSDLSILDSNRDGVINPYEALDALLFYRDYKGDDLTISSLAKLGSTRLAGMSSTRTERRRVWAPN